MKNHFVKISSWLICSVLCCSCASLADTLPDGYYDTADTAASAQPSERSAAPSSVTSEAASEETSVPTSTVQTEVSTEELSDIPTETVSVSETAISETTASETTVSETTVSETTTTLFEPGTLPPQTSAQTQSSPVVTIVTVPTAVPAQTSGQHTAASDTQAAYYPENDYYALNFDRQKAVWFSYLEYDRIMKNASEEDFTQSLGICFDNIAALGCNTVYFQVRSCGDAYYDSGLFPRGDRLTGDYDPLEIAVKLAHDRGLSIHAWINPMRLMTDSQMAEISSEYPIGKWYADPSKNGTYIVNSGGRWYLSPAYGETVSLICDGVREIVTCYNVDGVQIDDYFYPTTDESFDRAAYSASGTSLSLDDWRRDIVTKMVRQMYYAVHSSNPEAVFGISPQGSTANDFNTLYADIYTWCASDDCCDYICPQIYYGFENASLPYAQTLAEWARLTEGTDISLVAGLAAYKSGTVDNYAGDGKNEWLGSTDILARQRELTDIYGAGYAFFRYDSLFVPSPSVSAYVNAELENLKK